MESETRSPEAASSTAVSTQERPLAETNLGWWDRCGESVWMASAYRDEVIESAQGVTFRDVEGNEFLDMSAGQMCATVGHNHPHVLARVQEQLGRVAHTATSFLSPVVFECSERLAAVAPGDLSRSILLSTGAEANEYALRVAKAYTGKSGVLALTRGYAGLTLQTASLTGYGKNARPIVPGTGHILTPDPTACPADCSPLDMAKELLHQSLEIHTGILADVGAIIVEPILSAGGLIVLPDGFLRELREVADRLEALLIVDEAQTGMGRTGRWFAVEHDDVVPDLLVASKGVGGGFALSAVVTRPEIADAVMGRANQFSSHQSEPLAAAAGLAVIETIESEGLVERARESGAYLLGRLGELAAREPRLANVRGKGLMVGFDVFREPGSRRPERDVGRAVEDACRRRGVHVQSVQKNRFRVIPPLVIERDDLDRFVDVLEAALAELASGQLRIDPPRNRFTAEFRRKEAKGLKAALEWAWTHSPQVWLEKFRARVGARKGRRK